MWLQLKKQFTNGSSDEEMMMEKIRELSTIKETNKVTSEQVLCWTKKVEVQRAQKALLEATKEKECKESDAIKRADKQNQSIQSIKKQRTTPKQIKILWHPT